MRRSRLLRHRRCRQRLDQDCRTPLHMRGAVNNLTRHLHGSNRESPVPHGWEFHKARKTGGRAAATRPDSEIGRASCRESVWISVVAGAVEKKSMSLGSGVMAWGEYDLQMETQ